MHSPRGEKLSMAAAGVLDIAVCFPLHKLGCEVNFHARGQKVAESFCNLIKTPADVVKPVQSIKWQRH